MKQDKFIYKIVGFFLISESVFFSILFFIIYPNLGISLDKIIKTMGPIIAFVIIVFVGLSLLLYKMLTPLKNSIANLENDNFTENDKNIILKSEKTLNKFLVIVNIIGYILASLMSFLMTFLLVDGFFRWASLRFLIGCFLSGFFISTIQIAFISDAFQKLKNASHIIELSVEKKFLNVKRMMILVFMSFAIWIATLLAFSLISREEYMAGINTVAYSLNSGKTEVAEGHFSKLLTLAQNSSDESVKAEADKIVADWKSHSFSNAVKSFGFAIFLLIIFAFGTYVYSGNISGHLDGIIKRLRNIVKLEGDLTQFIVKTSDNEIGEIQTLINQLIINLNKYFSTINETAISLVEQSQNEQKNIEFLISSNNDMKKSNEEFSASLINQKLSVQKATRTIKDVVTLIQENIDTMTNQSTMIEESSASITEMNVSIKSVSDATEKSTSLGLQLENASKEGQAVIGEMKDLITEISQKGEGITEIVETISSIASQTDLLAMNAAIEAAHAGESGKGFAVVADEIRKLAENTAGQTNEIENLLKSMTEIIQTTVSKSGNMSEAIEEISSDIGQTIRLINEIDNAAKEQLSASNENLSATQELVTITANIMENLDKQKIKTEEMIKVTDEMESSKEKLESVGSKQDSYQRELNKHFDNFYLFFNSTNEQLMKLGDQLKKLKLVDKKMLDKI